jgi:hypothetical protein
VPGRRLPGSPRASRAMIDLLYAVAACGDVVGSWDVTGQPGGAVVRARSRQLFDEESEAAAVAETILKRLAPGSHELVSSAAGVRPEGRSADRWRGVAEVVVGTPDDSEA